MWLDLGRGWPWMWKALPLGFALVEALPVRNGKAKESIVPADLPRPCREHPDVQQREFERLLMMLHS